MELTDGAFDLTEHSEVSSIVPKVGSTEFTDITLDKKIFYKIFYKNCIIVLPLFLRYWIDI